MCTERLKLSFCERHPPWQGGALPTELRPQILVLEKNEFTI